MNTTGIEKVSANIHPSKLHLNVRFPPPEPETSTTASGSTFKNTSPTAPPPPPPFPPRLSMTALPPCPCLPPPLPLTEAAPANAKSATTLPLLPKSALLPDSNRQLRILDSGFSDGGGGGVNARLQGQNAPTALARPPVACCDAAAKGNRASLVRRYTSTHTLLLRCWW